MPVKVTEGVLHLSSLNSKLGRIQNISIMPGEDCPGETDACASVCYANKGSCTMAHGYWGHNSKILRENPYALLRLRDRIKGPVFRIHVGGDFFGTEYVRAWMMLVKMRSDVIFWTYTRSWSIPQMLPLLREFGKLPNVHLWWSCDRDTGEPPVDNFRRAYMSMEDSDVCNYHVDLIFRVNRNTVIKKVGKTPVCPVENGIKHKRKINCKKCGICFR